MPDDPEPLGMGFAKDEPALKTSLNAALASMRVDGTLAALAGRWGVPG